MNKQLTLSALAMAALLAGCASSGDYAAQVPALAVPAAYGSAAAPTQPLPALEPARTGDVRNDPWWQGFGDARLDRLVAQALAANPDLAAAGFRLAQARLAARLADNSLAPQPSGSVSASASRRIDTGDSTERSYGATLGLSWEADLFGRLRAERDVQAWQARASADDLQATALALVGDVCTSWWTLAYLNQSIAAGEQDLAALERILKLVEVQHAEGDVSLLELREARQSLESQRASQSALQQQREETRNGLAVLLDGQPWPQADEPQTLEDVRLLDVRAGLPAELLGRRPDLRAAERRLRASLANVDATARSYYPALTLTGSVGGSSTSLTRLLQDPVAALGAGLTLPFLNVERMRLGTESAGAAYLQAASEFRGTLHSALQEVDNALSARERLRTQAAARRISYEAAQDVARLYEVRYREGASPLRTWLDAQHTLRGAELALAQLLRQQAANDVTLMLALGGS